MTPTDKFVEAMRVIYDEWEPPFGSTVYQDQFRQAVEAFAHATCPDEQHCETCECDEDYHKDDFPDAPEGNRHKNLCLDPLLKRVME